jgi:GT2 family glycosyltransferase
MSRRAKGEYLLLLNNDAALFPNTLKRLFQEAARGPAILGPAQFNAETGLRIDNGNLLDPFFNTVPNLDPRRAEVAMVSGGCMWIPKWLWEELGGFPEWFHTLSEDIYICCLARLKGYPVRALSDAGFYHWVGSNLGGGKLTGKRMSTSVRRRALSERNRSYVMVMTLPSPIFNIIFPLHLTFLILEGVLMAVLKRQRGFFERIYLMAVREICLNYTFLLSCRYKIQKMRKVSCSGFLSVFSLTPYKIIMLFRHGLPELQ